ncbi:MAG: hypothetical protein H0U75_02165 [Legionella sp.]|nr:hypothetical protein [Legionella sp.]
MIRALFLIMLCHCGLLAAEETDQFTLPPFEIQDIGFAASNRLYAIIEEAKNQTNSDIQALLPAANYSKRAAHRLALHRQGSTFADFIYSKGGAGFPRWLRPTHSAKPIAPWQYEPLPWNTIYWKVFSQSPFSILRLTPTIKMFGFYFGSDKIGHFFMQGHTYFKLYQFLLLHHKTPQQAQALMIQFGRFIETTYLGTMVNGVYSNADLSANFAGFKFYMNLTHPVQIGSKLHPPILVLKNDQWTFSPHVNKDRLLEPFLSNHLNEAWNPSHYTFMRGQIRINVKQRCTQWIERLGLTPEMVGAQLAQTRLWHGEEYGHWLAEHQAVTLLTCFGGN